MEKIKKAEIKRVRGFLQGKKARDEENVFVAEGVKIVEDALAKGNRIESILVSSKVLAAPSTKRLLDLTEKKKIKASRVPAAEFEWLSNLRNSQGILAIIEKPAIKKISAGDVAGFSILCDGVQDPGNMGAIVRSAAAFGVSSIIMYGQNADVFNPKVVRASAGTVMDVSFFEADPDDIDKLKAGGSSLIGSVADASKGISLKDFEIPEGPCILVFGSEGRGISDGLERKIDKSFYIPILDKVESLNVTAAAAIALYVLTRQKQKIV